MSLNGLTGSAGLKLGPLVLETLVKHYFERLKVSQKIPATTSSDGVAHDAGKDGSMLNNNLRKEELLYDQAFTIVKVSIARVLPHLPSIARDLRRSRVSALCLGCASLSPVADPRNPISPSLDVALRIFCLLLPGK